MVECSITRGLEIVRGGRGDYELLGRFHYRGWLGPFVAIFSMKRRDEVAGVIVYTMPSAGLELRDVATGGLFSGFGRSTRLKLINRNVRCIARVIVEPRFRGLGLGARLVRETMGLVGAAIVEAAAVMGIVNPFFEKAGMTAYRAKMPLRCVRLMEALSLVGIERDMLIDPAGAAERLERLGRAESELIESEIRLFLQCYGRRRLMQPGPERTQYVLSKLTERPVYYAWFNPDVPLSL